MKKSTIFMSILLVVFCAVVIQHIRAFAAIPMQFKPNWLAILPAIAIWAAGYKEVHTQVEVPAGGTKAIELRLAK